MFSDYQNEGCNYRLVAYRNLVTKEQYSVESIQKEIKVENRIGTLEQGINNSVKYFQGKEYCKCQN